MIKRDPADAYIKLIKDAMRDRRISVAKISRVTGLHSSSLGRIFKEQAGLSRPNAEAIVRAVNKIAGETVVDEACALELAGFKADRPDLVVYELAPGARISLDAAIEQDKREKIMDVLRIGYEIAIRKSN